MATCQGHRHGTGCYKRTKYPKAKNWKDHNLCHKCYCVVILGVIPKKGHGGKYLKATTVPPMDYIITKS